MKPMPERTRARSDFVRAYDEERRRAYPAVQAVEDSTGYALDPDRLLGAARDLACPVKANPPNWQHGRVLYSLTRQYLARWTSSAPVTLLDIGTAKGFSALCLQWALMDSGKVGRVHSADVVDPLAPVWRNTVREVDREYPMTLAEILEPWPDSQLIRFYGATGLTWLRQHMGARIGVAFVDGKHRGDVVRQEAQMIVSSQESGDLIVFDDVHLPDVRKEALGATRWYDQQTVEVVKGKRAYLICVRK